MHLSGLRLDGQWKNGFIVRLAASGNGIALIVLQFFYNPFTGG
jgi:hypothetical protein